MCNKPAKLSDIRRIFVQNMCVVDEATLQTLRTECEKEKYDHQLVDGFGRDEE